jgi:hypothetical protein
MYITFDYKCRECGDYDSRMVLRSEMDTQRCGKKSTTFPCRGRMVKLPAGTRTTFRFADTKLKD